MKKMATKHECWQDQSLDLFFHIGNLKLLGRWNGLSTHAVDIVTINYFDIYVWLCMIGWTMAHLAHPSKLALHFRHSKICSNLKATARLAYIVTDADCVIMGAHFTVFITFPNVSITHPVLVYSIVWLFSHSYGICIKTLWPLMVENFIKQASNGD